MNRIKRKENPVNPNGLTFPVNRIESGSMRGLQGQSIVLPFHYPRQPAQGRNEGDLSSEGGCCCVSLER